MTRRALVVFESMYGDTRQVAEAVAKGLRTMVEADVVGTADATPERVAQASVVVVGGPTHVHGMVSARSQKMTVDSEHDKAAAHDPANPAHELDETATGETVRHWLEQLARTSDGLAAAFDTRADRAALLTGSAARGIAKRLRHHGYELIADPTSFFVETSTGPLAPGELERAEAWGGELARLVAAARM